MKLKNWLEFFKVTIDEFAAMIGVSRSLVYKYIYYRVLPKEKIMQKIYRITHGLVSANDFYGLSHELLLESEGKESAKHVLKEEVLHTNSFRD